MWKKKPRLRETSYSSPKVFKANMWLDKNSTPGLYNNEAPTFKHYTHNHFVHRKNKGHQLYNSPALLRTRHTIKHHGLGAVLLT